MTTQFPGFYGDVPLPTGVVPCEQAEPVPQPAPVAYTDGAAQGHALVVKPEAVARQLGLPVPLDTAQTGTIMEAIMGAQSDVEAYLGRPVVPLEYTDPGCIPDRRGWVLRNYPVLQIISATPETDLSGSPSGLYTVVYIAGLDAVNNPELAPIARFIKLHACYDPFVQILFRQLRPGIATRVTSGSTEGQSATVTDALPAPSGSRMSSPAAVTAQMSLPGSPPTLQTLDRWRLGKRRVYQRPTCPGSTAPWPYDMPQSGLGEAWAGRWQTWW